MSEVMPMQIRGKGNAFATGVGNWAVATLWSQVSPIAIGAISWRFFFVFAAFSEYCNKCPYPHPTNSRVLDTAVALPTIFFLFKETKQKTLEEIDLLFGGRALGILPEDVTEKNLESKTATATAVETNVSARQNSGQEKV